MAHTTVFDRPAQPPCARDASFRASIQRPTVDRAAARDVLRQLDAWCRANGAPTGLNAWVAEEAVRRA